jgi:hypothetical protein
MLGSALPLKLLPQPSVFFSAARNGTMTVGDECGGIVRHKIKREEE